MYRLPLSLQIVQNFYTSQSLGGPQTPRASSPPNDATGSDCIAFSYFRAASAPKISGQVGALQINFIAAIPLPGRWEP